MNVISEDLFLFLSAYILIRAYYSQYESIFYYYGADLGKFYQTHNKNLIIAQVKGLREDVSNKYYFWSFTYAYIFLGFLCIYLFPKETYVLLILSMLLFVIQYLAEYLFFIFKIALSSERKDISAKQAVTEKEKITTYENISIQSDKKANLLNSVVAIEDLKYEIDYQKFTDAINSLNIFNKEWIITEKVPKEGKLIIKVVTDPSKYKKTEEFLIEVYGDDVKIEKVIKKDSNYVNSFYEYITFERIYVYGYLEPIIATVILYVTIKF